MERDEMASGKKPHFNAQASLPKIGQTMGPFVRIATPPDYEEYFRTLPSPGEGKHFVVVKEKTESGTCAAITWLHSDEWKCVRIWLDSLVIYGDPAAFGWLPPGWRSSAATNVCPSPIGLGFKYIEAWIDAGLEMEEWDAIDTACVWYYVRNAHILWRHLKLRNKPSEPSRSTSVLDLFAHLRDMLSRFQDAFCEQEGRENAPHGPTNAAELFLQNEDVAILRSLSQLPERLKSLSLIRATSGVCEKTAGKRVLALIAKGLVHRPEGERGGAQITKAGLDYLKSRSPTAP